MRWSFMCDEDVTNTIVESALKVHSALGPGLLEHVYEMCLSHELMKRNLSVRKRVPQPVVYDGVQIDAGYHLNLLVEDRVVVECRAVENLDPLHDAQMLTCLRLSKYRTALLLNFNVVHMKNGIKRIAL